MSGGTSQYGSQAGWPLGAPRTPPQSQVPPQGGRSRWSAWKEPGLCGLVCTGVLTVVLALTYWYGTPRPARGPYEPGQPVGTVLEVRPYLLPSVSWVVLGLTLLSLCAASATASSWAVSTVWSARTARWAGFAPPPSRARRVVPGLVVGWAVSVVVAAHLFLGWLTTGPQVSETACPRHPAGSCVELGWGWAELDRVVFERDGLVMVPVRVGGSG